MTIGELFADFPGVEWKKVATAEVTSLITDSRRVVPGALFFAISGLRTDGMHYVEEAIERGAIAVVADSAAVKNSPIPFIRVDDTRVALATISRRFYNFPDRKLKLFGVTGTNGKTTVAMLLQHLLGGEDQVGLLGTVRYDIGRRTLPSFRTTPESVDIHALIDQMVRNGCKEAVMEVSSHGIDQKRVDEMQFDVTAFLNLTRDHLDYHKSVETYFRTKRKLFDGGIGVRPRAAVINVDDPYGRRLVEEVGTGIELFTFGIEQMADVRASNIQLFADRTIFELEWPGGHETVVSPLLGRYNVSNLIAALAMARAAGHRIERLIPKVAGFPGVPGRMERIDAGQSFNVLVDYAHTDDALKNALEMLREITPGRVLVVFGCGGDRDRKKRVPMTRAVLDRADRVWATSDNPRGESLEQIFADMRKAVREGEPIDFLEDRRLAIRRAIAATQPGDCVLIAGKGHESFQEMEGTVIPFDDRRIARELLGLRELHQESESFGA